MNKTFVTLTCLIGMASGTLRAMQESPQGPEQEKLGKKKSIIGQIAQLTINTKKPNPKKDHDKKIQEAILAIRAIRDKPLENAYKKIKEDIKEFGYRSLLETDLKENIKLKDINQKGYKKQTLLHLACERGSLATVKLLIAQGADLAAEDSEKRTPIQLALKNNHESIAGFLYTTAYWMKFNPKTDQRDPLEVAVLKEHTSILDLLALRYQKQEKLSQLQQLQTLAEDIFGKALTPSK